MERLAEGEENPAIFAVLGCPDTVTITMKNICAANPTDAEAIAAHHASKFYNCENPCVLNILPTAGAAGGQCWINNQPPWTPGRLYDVTLVISCR